MNILEARRRMLGAEVYKKTVTGNPAVAQGSLARRGPGITMQGWTEQAQYKGNQLFDASKLQTRSVGGAAVTNNGDGSFTVSGSGNLSSVFSYYYDYSHEETIELLQSGEKIKVNQTSTVIPTIVMQLIQSETTQQTVSTGGYTITEDDIQNPDFHIRLLMYGNSGAEIVPGTYKPMVYQDGDGTWEPYTGGAPSPSPDYPQEIASAGNYDEASGEYKVDVGLNGSNLFDISKVNSLNGIVNNGDGTITVNAPSGSSAISTNKTLRELCNGISTGTYFLQADTTGRNKYIYIGRVWNFGTSTELTDEDLEEYVLLYASGINTTATISNIMINHGEAPLPWEPYKPPQTVTLTADRPLTKWDRLEKRNGQWGWVYKSEEIESYTDESVPGEYFSTTGRLSTGAQVWYETTTETFVPLTASEQTQMNALHTNRPTTVLSNDCECNMSLTYKTKKSMGGGNLLDYRKLVSVNQWIGTGNYRHFNIALKPNTTYILSCIENNMYNGYKVEYNSKFAFYLGENIDTFVGNKLFGNTNTEVVSTEYQFTTTENPYYINCYNSNASRWNSENLHIIFDELLPGLKLQEVT